MGTNTADFRGNNVIALPSIEAPGKISDTSTTKQKPPSHLRRWLFIALAIAAVIVAVAIAEWVLGPEAPSFIVAKGNIIQTVVASGRVETPLRIEIGSEITGTVAAIPVAEGQMVQANQLLIALENSDAKAAVAAARAAVVQAEARLKQITDVALPSAEQALNRAQITLGNSRKQYERVKDLKTNGFVGESQLDDAQTTLDLAESELRTAQLQVQTNRPTGGDFLVAKTALEQAKANLFSAQSKLGYTAIKAPAAGTLIARSVERGNVVQPGKMLMLLSPAAQTQLVVEIDEKNLASLSLGQPALVSADAYPEQKFPAKVVYINPGIDADRGSVEVKLDVPNAPAYLRQDMTVSIDIEVARRMDTLVLAADAVHDSTKAKPWVMKVVDAHAQREDVKLGARGAGKVEILEGLQAGDHVLATSANVKVGARVRTASAASSVRK